MRAAVTQKNEIKQSGHYRIIHLFFTSERAKKLPHTQRR